MSKLANAVSATSSTFSADRDQRHMPEVYSLKWNSYQSYVAAGLARLLEDQEYTDVTLACDGRFIQAHKLLLSLCSPYFKRMFQINKAQQNANTIVILNNIQYQDLENIIKFMYNGEVNVRNVDFDSFLRTGEQLQVEGLSSASALSSLLPHTTSMRKGPPEPLMSVRTAIRTDAPTVQTRTSRLSDGSDSNRLPLSQHSSRESSTRTLSTKSASSTSASQNLTITPRIGTSTRSITLLNDPLGMITERREPEEIEIIDPFHLNGIEISEVGNREEFDMSDHTSLGHDRHDERYQKYEPGHGNSEMYTDHSNNPDEEEEYIEMTEDIFEDSNSPQSLNAHGRQQYQHRRQNAEYRNAAPYRVPEQRRKTSALWDYFEYDTERDLVQCQLKRNGVLCHFNARHKPLSNMKYHIRTCHPQEFEIILPRLINR